MGARERKRRRIGVVRVGERGIVVKTTGGSSRTAQWVYPIVAAAVASVLWMQGGIVAGVGFATVVGLFQPFLIWAERKASQSEPTSGLAWVPLAGGCLWVTAASATMVAILVRTLNAPVLEALATCYVVAIGSAVMGSMVKMAREDAARRGG